VNKSTFEIETPTPQSPSTFKPLNDVCIVETLPDGTIKRHRMDEQGNHFTFASAKLWILNKEA